MLIPTETSTAKHPLCELLDDLRDQMMNLGNTTDSDLGYKSKGQDKSYIGQKSSTTTSPNNNR
jgi:hypothetical protein